MNLEDAKKLVEILNSYDIYASIGTRDGVNTATITVVTDAPREMFGWAVCAAGYDIAAAGGINWTTGSSPDINIFW